MDSRLDKPTIGEAGEAPLATLAELAGEAGSGCPDCGCRDIRRHADPDAARVIDCCRNCGRPVAAHVAA